MGDSNELIRLNEAVFASLREGVIVVDENGRVAGRNARAEAILGLEDGRLLGQPCADARWKLLRADATPLPDAEHPAALALRTGQPLFNEVLGVCKPDGTTAWISVNAVPLFRPGQTSPYGATASFADITERKHVFESLLESEENWRSMVENAPDTIIIVDRSGRIEFLNRPGPIFAGSAGIGASIFDSLPQEERPRVEDVFARILETGDSERFSIDAAASDGSPRIFHVGVGPIRKSGRRASLVLVVADITQRRETEKKLEETELQLRQAQKMEAVGRLAGGVAHDFNNLLTTILGYCEMLLSSLPKRDPHRGEIKEIKDAADRAAALTRQLLAFSRRQVLAPRVMDLNETLSELDKMLRRLIGEDIELAMRLDPKLSRVRADPGQITQVIMNLAVNSRDAMPRGGRLLIETRNVTVDEGVLSRHDFVAPGPYAQIAVSDTGCGMSPEVQSHLFEPFYSTKEKGKGTGLGLSTVYGIIKQSNGYIWAYSEIGKGTAFKIYLPPTDGRAPAAKAAGEGESPRGTETILLVEDEESVRKVLARMLKTHHYKVLTAVDGTAALRLLDSTELHVDLVVSDLVMPRMGGRELAQRLATLRPDLKIIFMSGYTEDSLIMSGGLDNAASFLQKPISSKDLLGLIRRELDR